MNDAPFILIPKVSIHPGYLAIFKEVQWIERRKYPPRQNCKMPYSHNHNGVVSNRSAAKIKDAINWLLLFAKNKELKSSFHGKTFKFKLSFITLTLSSKQIHSDNEIKELLLNQFLVEARKKWRVKDYLWRAEPQSNGNIHFHIVCDKFIPWSELRDTWNRIQNKLGYVDRYRDEMKAFHAGGFNVRVDLLKTWAVKKQIRAYRTGSKNDWNSPNSTDIHSINHISNLPAYLAKYCTKNDQGRKIEGRLWGLSESLSQCKGIIEYVDDELIKELKDICRKYPEKVIQHDYYTVILVSVLIWAKQHKGRLYELFRNYIYEHRYNSS
jgi:hypothetical protein